MLRWLSPEDRDRRNKRIVYLKDVKGMTFMQIAGRFNIGRQTVWTAYHKEKAKR